MWESLNSAHLSVIFAFFGLLFVAGLALAICMSVCGSGVNREEVKEERKKSWHQLCENITIPTLFLLPTDDVSKARHDVNQGRRYSRLPTHDDVRLAQINARHNSYTSLTLDNDFNDLNQVHACHAQTHARVTSAAESEEDVWIARDTVHPTSSHKNKYPRANGRTVNIVEQEPYRESTRDDRLYPNYAKKARPR